MTNPSESGVAVLLPCPFCECPAIEIGDTLNAVEAPDQVACTGCAAMADKAVWNQRAHTEPRGPEVSREALRRVFLAAHSDGWTGNQCRRDVQHVDAEKSWALYVANGALEKALTPSTKIGEGWQPIETAPRDGSYVLGFGPYDTRRTYMDVVHFFMDRWTITWMEGYQEPTHWRPLPAPPLGQDIGSQAGEG